MLSRTKTARLIATLITMAVAAFVTWQGGLHAQPQTETVKTEVRETVAPPPVEEPVVATPSSTWGNALVTRTVDGDTVVVKLDAEPGEFKVRLLGINTPESVDPRRPVECFGKEASKHAKALLEGKRVRLEADPQADERDKYDRLLRIVYMEDGRQFNRLMVEDGYASAYVTFPMNKDYKRELKDAEKDAKLAQRGLWSPDTCNGKK